MNAEVVNMYAVGYTPMQIAAKLYLSRYDVLNILHKEGVERRRLDLTDDKRARLRTLVAEGAVDHRYIARTFHISCEVAKLVLKGHPF